ncbi:hypothetical protein N8881_10160 [Pseudomonadales bacterium]|nr:hypothetical protein [Pseudomonadales bacterium]
MSAFNQGWMNISDAFGPSVNNGEALYGNFETRLLRMTIQSR